MARAIGIEAEWTASQPVPVDLAQDRARGIERAAFWNEGVPEVREVEEHLVVGDGGPVHVRLYRGTLGPAAPVVLYIHGGGWAQGSIVQNEPAIRSLVAQSGWTVAATSYRFAPEHPFPAGLDDCMTAWKFLASRGPGLGLDPARVVISGTSAGGNLALAAALAGRRQDLPQPAGLLLFYGVFSADLATGSYRAYGDGRFGLPQARMAQYFDWYDPEGKRHQEPLITPMLGDLAGLPPTWLVAAELDVLHDDTIMMHERMTAAGVPCQIRRVPGVVHGFINRGKIVGAARETLAHAAAFLKGLP